MFLWWRTSASLRSSVKVERSAGAVDICNVAMFLSMCWCFGRWQHHLALCVVLGQFVAPVLIHLLAVYDSRRGEEYFKTALEYDCNWSDASASLDSYRIVRIKTLKKLIFHTVRSNRSATIDGSIRQPFRKISLLHEEFVVPGFCAVVPRNVGMIWHRGQHRHRISAVVERPEVSLLR